jgi:hypothetical protein
MRCLQECAFVAGLVMLQSACGTDLSSPPPIPDRPFVEQLLVTDAESNDPLSGLAISYGVVRDVNACDNPEIEYACPSGTSCRSVADGPKECLDAQDRAPIARSVPIEGFAIHVVFGSLLKGTTVDQWACDCSATGGVCAGGHQYSVDPFDCSICQSGQCLVTDADGLSEVAALQAGIALIRCGTVFAYANQPSDGFYNPSGSQYSSSVIGLGGLGPALVFKPHVSLPLDSDCTVELSDRIRTKDGKALLPARRPLAFHTL